MPKLEEIFTTVIIAWHRHARLAVLKIIARSICFDMVKALRNFWEKLSTSKIKKKRRSREETLRFFTWKILMPKFVIWHKSSNSQAIRHEASLSFFSFLFEIHSIKRIDSMLSCVSSFIDCKFTSKCGVVRTSVTQPIFILNTLRRHLWFMNGRTETWNLSVELIVWCFEPDDMYL